MGPKMPESVFVCKYCPSSDNRRYFRDKKLFAEHKRLKHWDEMSDRSDLHSSIVSGQGSNVRPPQKIPRVQREEPPPESPPEQARTRRGGNKAMEPPPPPTSPSRRGQKKQPPQPRVPSTPKKKRTEQPDSPSGSGSESDAPAPTPKSPSKKKNKKRPGPPEGVNPRNLPLPIGQKKINKKTGKEEWHKNPKLKGA